MFIIIIYFIIFAVAFLGIKLFLRLNKKWNILDVPNERSSHTRPTPRGGGLVIVLVSLLAYTIYTNFFTREFSWAYFGGAILIVSISWLDDLYSVSSLLRFIVHSIAAGLIVLYLGESQSIYIPFYGLLKSNFCPQIIIFLWIVWLTNAYNFMDGIDALAGMQAVTAGLGWLMVGKILGQETAGFYGGVIAFSSLGFLIFNRYPAKIFMGDVGSAFLGYTFAVFPFLFFRETVIDTAILPVVAILLVWLFVFDTVLTLTRRLFKREKIWQAHRSHIYQRLVAAGVSQVKVTGLYVLISLTIIILIFINLRINNFWSATIIIITIESLGLFIFSRIKERSKTPELN
ncbi:MAG: glycosyltransferase family 4 protein [Acidobacteria bacterium]|nr:glycosyltransferase family 4 protein [Acidobacteriota bacterium]